MATISVTPESFEIVSFDAGEIVAIASEVANAVGLDPDAELVIEIDENVMVPRVETNVEGKRVEMKVTGGAFEDQRRARTLSADRTRALLAVQLLRARDRMDPRFAGAPAHADLTVQQSSAWDTYAEGRLARLGLPARRPRRLYHFRLRHGFSDDIDAVFERLWQADGLGWADLQAACDETAELKLSTGAVAAR